MQVASFGLKPIHLFRVFFCFLFLGALSAQFSFRSFALPLHSFDLRGGLNARSYPIGAQFFGTGAYNFLLWDRTGDQSGDQSGNQAWKYGYLRAALNLASAAVVNRAGVELQFFPISIFGVSAGYDWSMRNFTPPFGDCGRYECNGRLDRQFVKGHLFLGYQDFIFAGYVRYERLKSLNGPKPFFDEITLLVGNQRGEHVLTYNPALFYRIDDRWKAGAISLYSRALDVGAYSHLFGPVASWNPESRFNILSGVGLNRSPVVHTGWCGFFVISYVFEPSLGIGDRAIRSP